VDAGKPLQTLILAAWLTGSTVAFDAAVWPVESLVVVLVLSR
jgi:hypothetical protein